MRQQYENCYEWPVMIFWHFLKQNDNSSSINPKEIDSVIFIEVG